MLLKLKTNTNVQKIIKLKFNIADRDGKCLPFLAINKYESG